MALGLLGLVVVLSWLWVIGREADDLRRRPDKPD